MASQHAAQALQAEHARRRHPRSAGDQLAEGHRRRAASCATSSATPAISSRRCSTLIGLDAAGRRSTACRRCRSRATASPPACATPPRRRASAPQYFEMFGHRGLWQDGWKAVAFHPPGHALRRATAGSFTISTRTSRRPTTSPTSDPERLQAHDRALVERGRALPGAAARRSLRPALRRERGARAGPSHASSCSTPAWAMCRPTLRPTCAAAAI